MIRLERSQSGSRVTVNGKEIEIIYDSHDSVVAECSFDALRGVSSEPFPKELTLEVTSKDGFGTFLFHRIFLYFRFKTEFRMQFMGGLLEKYWNGHRDLYDYTHAICGQLLVSHSFTVDQFEEDEDGVILTAFYHMPQVLDQNLATVIMTAVRDLNKCVTAAERTLEAKENKRIRLVGRNEMKKIYSR